MLSISECRETRTCCSTILSIAARRKQLTSRGVPQPVFSDHSTCRTCCPAERTVIKDRPVWQWRVREDLLRGYLRSEAGRLGRLSCPCLPGSRVDEEVAVPSPPVEILNGPLPWTMRSCCPDPQAVVSVVSGNCHGRNLRWSWRRQRGVSTPCRRCRQPAALRPTSDWRFEQPGEAESRRTRDLRGTEAIGLHPRSSLCEAASARGSP